MCLTYFIAHTLQSCFHGAHHLFLGKSFSYHMLYHFAYFAHYKRKIVSDQFSILRLLPFGCLNLTIFIQPSSLFRLSCAIICILSLWHPIYSIFTTCLPRPSHSRNTYVQPYASFLVQWGECFPSLKTIN